MARARPSSQAEATPDYPLTASLDRIADELQLVRVILDELRTDFQWAVQNGRVKIVLNDAPATNDIELLPLFDEGDSVEVDHNRLHGFGEVIAVDDARNEATVLLIPSNESVTVSQDCLRRVDPDQLCRQPASEPAEQPASQHATAERDMPPPGNLF